MHQGEPWAAAARPGYTPDPASRGSSFASLAQTAVNWLSFSPGFVSWNFFCTSQELRDLLIYEGSRTKPGQGQPSVQKPSGNTVIIPILWKGENEAKEGQITGPQSCS